MSVKLISFLITHYNRPKSLLKCIESIRKQADGINYEIVVSDDYSTLENLKFIKNISGIHLIESNKNQGLASNINKGIAACKGEFIVYIQEDFRLLDNFNKELGIILITLNKRELDMVRLRSTSKFAFSAIIAILLV